MTPERFRESLPLIVCTVLGLLFAFCCGRIIGANNTKMLLIIFGGLGFLAIGIIFRSKVWLLIPLTAMATGRIPSLPLPFSVADLGIIAAFVWYLIFRAVRIVNQKPVYSRLDLFLFVNLAYLLFTYLRNPIGTLAFDSDLIGGRPYFDVFLAFCGYLVIQRATLDVSLARKIPWLYMISSSLTVVASAITHFFPSTVPIFARLYTGIVVDEYLREESGTAEDNKTRLGFLTGFGSSLSLLLASFFRPITLLIPLYPWRFLGFAMAGMAILLSGFRNTIVAVGGYFLLANLYQRRLSDLCKLFFYAIPVVAMLLFLQGRAIELPFAVQRSLSFIPLVKWSNDAKMNANHSVEWRLYMWQLVMEDRKYWKNRLLGDGFGFSRNESRTMTAAVDMKLPTATQDNFLITGDIHSGPLSVARTVGYVGSILFLGLYIMAGVYAHRLIKEARNTPFFPIALFFGIPAIYTPFHFIFIYGSFKSDFPHLILMIAYLQLISRGLKLYLENQAKEKQAKAAADSATGTVLDQRPPLPSLLPQR